MTVSPPQRIAQLPENLLQTRIAQRRVGSGQKLMMRFAEVIGHCLSTH